MRFAWCKPVASVAVLLLCLLIPALSNAAEPPSVIRGTVIDSNGAPVEGALVIVTGIGPMMPERNVSTDKRGMFVISLRAGDYSVKVASSRFLPIPPSTIHLPLDATATMTVKLQTVREIASSRSSAKESQDIVWTLRSSRSIQPVWRFAEIAKSSSDTPTPDYSGYYQLYSKSMETSEGQ